ncbi:MAG: radical SAM protein [Candidatus Aenigmarchaeota archaeon]|nr:radical SAM protein [Candidatus Aenigmarchaeota archaeon]
MKKRIVRIPEDADLPLIGAIMFGIIDRGTNMLQVRATTVCNLNCIFCSTDAGPLSKTRVTEYVVRREYLIEWLKEVIKYKGSKNIEVFLDSVGETLTYPEIVDLVQDIWEIKGVRSIGIETNGTLLTQKLIDELEEANLSRINLSLHAIDEDLAKKLVGSKDYDVKKIMKICEYVASTKIELLITPVWIPGINDKEIEKIIEFSKKINKNKRWPFLGIQKYEVHKYGRKIKGIKTVSWWKFYRKLEEWEKKFNVKLKIGPRDFGIFKLKPLQKIFKKGQKVKVEIKAPGWMRNQTLGAANERCITVINSNHKPGDLVNTVILSNKDNLYIAKPFIKTRKIGYMERSIIKEFAEELR